jgi:hypothetical protein
MVSTVEEIESKNSYASPVLDNNEATGMPDYRMAGPRTAIV